MNLIPVGDVNVSDDRQRQQFDGDALEELTASIESVGLLHPIVLREGRFLVAGERRFRAIQNLYLLGRQFKHSGNLVPAGLVPFVDLGTLSPSEQYEAELDENTKRADLTWQELATARKRLAELRMASGSTKPQAIAEVASDVLPETTRLAAQHLVRQSITLAEHLDDPDIAKAKTQRDAFKILARKVTAKQNAALAAEVGLQAPSDLHTLVHADCVTWLKAYNGPKFDVLLTDPPYGMDADSFGDGAGKLVGIDHQYKDSTDHALGLIERMLEAANPHMQEEAHLYLYCDIDLFLILRELTKRYGWTPHRTPLIHVKREGGRVPWPTSGPRRAFELVLYAQRGGKPVTAILPDVFDTSLTEGNLGHGAQKPVEGFVNLLKRSVRPGDRVLDAFGGTGTLLVAAQQLSCHATVIEKEAQYFGLAARRLADMNTPAMMEVLQEGTA